MLRESSGNAVFFSVYEYVRYYMHSQLKAASSENSHMIDAGIGILSGGLGGVAVSLLTTSACFLLKCYVSHISVSDSTKYPSYCQNFFLPFF